MRARIALLALTAVAASSGQCGGTPPYDPCEGKACGETCRICPPDDAQCAETAVAKACDPFGSCVPAAPGLCAPASAACAGKACGAECVIEPPCRTATPPCMVPSILGRCDAAGACVTVVPVCPPVTSCAGQVCGTPCDPCGGMCLHPYASQCDLLGQCVPVTAWICWDPCAGKACGAGCRLCPSDAPGCVEPMVVEACDASGRCVAAGSVICP